MAPVLRRRTKDSGRPYPGCGRCAVERVQQVETFLVWNSEDVEVVRRASGRDAKDLAFTMICGPAMMTAMNPTATPVR